MVGERTKKHRRFVVGSIYAEQWHVVAVQHALKMLMGHVEAVDRANEALLVEVEKGYAGGPLRPGRALRVRSIMSNACKSLTFRSFSPDGIHGEDALHSAAS